LHRLKDVLKSLLQRSTVKLTIPGTLGWGTGFLVTHDLVLTCAHVIREEGNPVNVHWQQQSEFFKATVEKIISDPIDLALLRLSEPKDEAICACLDFEQNDLPEAECAYLFGYPDIEGYLNGCPVLVTCEGFLGGEFPFIKFKSGQVRPGMSGSPILNLATGKVFGVVKRSRDRSSDLGGDGISTAMIFRHFPELMGLQKTIYQTPSLWQAALMLPEYVQEAKKLISRSYARSRCIDGDCSNKWLPELRKSYGLSETETKAVERDLLRLCENLHEKIDDILPTFEQEIFGFFQSETDFKKALPKLRAKLEDLGISLGLNSDRVKDLFGLSLCQYIDSELLPAKSEQAILIYKESIKENPDFEKFYIGLGICLSNKRNFREAINVFLRAQKIIEQKRHLSNNPDNLNNSDNLDKLIQDTRSNHRNKSFSRISPILRLTLIIAIVFIGMKATFINKIILTMVSFLISEILPKILQFLRRLLRRIASR
jgi:tetratricopeptide (TPR) repeat protein